MDEETYKKELAEQGVEVPQDENPTPVETPDPQKEEAPQPEAPEADKEPLQEPPKEKKRSIYDEYKDKKVELKTERELREQAERERDEFKQKWEALQSAETPEEKKVAGDEFEQFAQEIGADAQAIRKMRDLFLKDVKPTLDDSIKKDLDEFKVWKSQNQHVIEKQLFEDEFKKTLPTLKQMFPTASDEEMNAIRDELDKVSHTKEWHDKELDYVAFKNREKLEPLISPKKKGLEGKGRIEAEFKSTEFDPNADYLSMSPDEREKWEEQYRSLSKSDSLLTNSQGKKILL